MNQINWYEQFKSAQEEENEMRSSRWMQIATVAQDGTPRVRTVVFRGWGGINKLFFLTDSRSQKVDDISKTPDVEICYLFLNSLCQFRFKGIAEINQGDFASQYWESLSPEVKAMWFWPDPGKALIKENQIQISMANRINMPKNFIVIFVNLSEVELLKIKKFPHERIVWKASEKWKTTYINA